MKKFRFLILLMVLAFGAGSIYAHKTALAASQLEITEIKNAGVSAARETHHHPGFLGYSRRSRGQNFEL